MAHLLRALNLLTYFGLILVILQVNGSIYIPYPHIILALAVFLAILFVQAFTMFFFIGISRMGESSYQIFFDPKKREEHFGELPKDIVPYEKLIKKIYHDSTLAKRKVIPWCMLIQLLTGLSILLGGAFDTGVVGKTVHKGTAYGLLLAFTFGLLWQWRYLGKAHILIRKIKELFQIPDNVM